MGIVLALATPGLLPLEGTGAGAWGSPGPFHTIRGSSVAPLSGPGRWVDVNGGPPPSARLWNGLAYDAADGYFVLFGGHENTSILGDTWVFRNGAWTNLTATVSPSPGPRYYPAMAWDPAERAVVLFGGSDGTHSLSDTWFFAGGHWTNVSTAVGNPPAGRGYAAMTYDSAAQEILLFGGFNETNFREYDDTWAFQSGRWANLSSRLSAEPPGRPDAGFSDDPPDHGVLLFGGDGPGEHFLADTWLFAEGRWHNLTSVETPSPSAREDPGAAFDGALSSVILFGGTTTPGAPNLSDTWVFTGGDWANLSDLLSVFPPARGGAPMAYDPNAGSLLMFGGAGATLLSDTWIYYPGPPTPSPGPALPLVLVLLASVLAAGVIATVGWATVSRARRQRADPPNAPSQ
jgi:galactose oxidase-like protein